MRPRCSGKIPCDDFLQHPSIYTACTAPRGLWRWLWSRLHPEKPAPLLHVELCTGKGMFLRSATKQYPDILWVGVEIAPGPLWQAMRAMEGYPDNCSFLWMDIRRLAAAFATKEIDRLYLHFCDPWPKRRHAHRRVTQASFLQSYARCLAEEGDLILKTDYAPFYWDSLQSLEAAGWKVLARSEDLHREAYGEEHTREPCTRSLFTEYEAQFVAQGKPIHYVRARPGRKLRDSLQNKT